MEEISVPTLDIMVGLAGSRSLNMNMAHGCHNNMVVHLTDFKSKPKTAGVESDAGRLREECWGRTSFPDWWRRLANEAVAVFRDLQQCDAQQAEPTLRLSLLKLSRRYRCCMRACMEALPAVATEDADGTPRQLLNKMEMLWHFCEIVLIERKRSGILYQLLDWVRQHAPQFDQSAVLVADAEVPESNPQYWTTVYGMVLQGRLDSARKLLRLHSGFQTEPFVSADELLRKMPLLTESSAGGAGAGPMADFEVRWRHWQEECIRRLEDGEFSFSHRLQTLVKILCGDAPTFEDLYREMGSWYHLMVSYLLYSKPWVGILDLSNAAEDSMEVFGEAACRSRMDRMLKTALDGDVLELLKIAQCTLPDGWLTTHLADLLHKLHSADGVLGRPLTYLAQLRHFLLLEFGTALFSARATWQLGALYLDPCGGHGRARLAVLLERLYPDSDRSARKIIQVAEARGMSEVASSVSRVMAQRARRAGRLGAALAWALRGHGAALASQLANTLIRQYTESGRFASADLIDNLGTGMLQSDRLMFLGKYREFHRLYAEGKQEEAAALLVTLLTSQMAPKFFWMTLLTDAVPLLESDSVIVSSAQTYSLIDCLEQLKLSGDLDDTEDDVKLIRLALSRNLARAIVTECSSIATAAAS